MDVWALMDYLRPRLLSEKLHDHFVSVEMRIISLLARMEIIGIGFQPQIYRQHAERFVQVWPRHY
jgi:hypothetical protein